MELAPRPDEEPAVKIDILEPVLLNLKTLKGCCFWSTISSFRDGELFSWNSISVYHFSDWESAGQTMRVSRFLRVRALWSSSMTPQMVLPSPRPHLSILWRAVQRRVSSWYQRALNGIRSPVSFLTTMCFSAQKTTSRIERSLSLSSWVYSSSGNAFLIAASLATKSLSA